MANRPIGWVPMNKIEAQSVSPRVSKRTKLKEALHITPTNSPDVQRKQSMSPYRILPDPAPRSPSSPTTAHIQQISPTAQGRHFFGSDFMAPPESDWMTQPRRRSLTPIPEMRLNNSPVSPGVHGSRFSEINPSIETQKEPDFYHEVETPPFHPDDIKVIIGQNNIRIIGEGSAKSERNLANFDKTIDIAFGTDPLSIKVEKRVSLVRLTGYATASNDNNIFGGVKNNFIEDQIPFSDYCGKQSSGSHSTDEYIECVVKLPNGTHTENIRYKTVSKHYLIVDCLNDTQSSSRETNDHKQGDFRQVFELPNAPESKVSSVCYGDETVIVRVPISR